MQTAIFLDAHEQIDVLHTSDWEGFKKGVKNSFRAIADFVSPDRLYTVWHEKSTCEVTVAKELTVEPELKPTFSKEGGGHEGRFVIEHTEFKERKWRSNIRESYSIEDRQYVAGGFNFAEGHSSNNFPHFYPPEKPFAITVANSIEKVFGIWVENTKHPKKSMVFCRLWGGGGHGKYGSNGPVWSYAVLDLHNTEEDKIAGSFSYLNSVYIVVQVLPDLVSIRFIDTHVESTSFGKDDIRRADNFEITKPRGKTASMTDLAPYGIESPRPKTEEEPNVVTVDLWSKTEKKGFKIKVTFTLKEPK